MSEDNGNVFKSEQAKANEGQPSGFGEKLSPRGLPPGVETLVITFDKNNGNLQVAGKIEDSILMYGMLEGARDVIFMHNHGGNRKDIEKIV